jgi:hypothetical protein
VARRVEWVLLAYRIPRERSTPRFTVWRKLKRLGIAQVVDVLVALPLDARTKEPIEWVGDEIIAAPEADGSDVICRGLSRARGDDAVLAVKAPAFDGLYEFVRRSLISGRDPA